MYMNRLIITGAFGWLFTSYAMVAHAWATGLDSTCIHDECNEKTVANTHLHIVNQALGYIKQLAESTDDPNVSDFASEIYRRMNAYNCRNLWELSLFDTDGPNLADIPRLGSHFYNPTNTDFYGFRTYSKTYKVFGLTMELFGTAKSNANDWIKSIDDIWNDDDDCWRLGFALHYFNDATQPMHAKGFAAIHIPFNFHPAWEDWISRRHTTTMPQSESGIDEESSLPSLSLERVVDPDEAFEEAALLTAFQGAASLRDAMHSWPKCQFLLRLFVSGQDQIPNTDEMILNAHYLLDRSYRLSANYIWSVFYSQPRKG